MIFEEECCQKYKLNSSSTYSGTKVKCFAIEGKHTEVKESVSCLSVGQVNMYFVNQAASLAYKSYLFPMKLQKVLNKSLNSEDLVLKHRLVCAAMELLLWVSAGFTLFLNDFSDLTTKDF